MMWPCRFGQAVVLLSTFFSASVALPTEITPQKLTQIFIQLDQDKDGKATLQDLVEFSKSMRTRKAQKDVVHMLQGKDTNEDGKMSIEEVLDSPTPEGQEKDESEKAHFALEAKKFKAADLNGDNFLDLSEAVSFFYPETHDEIFEISAKGNMQKKDMNNDGKLSLKEFWLGGTEFWLRSKISEIPDEQKEIFGMLDTDGNGSIDVNEFKSWENGQWHMQKLLRQLFDVADSDRDGAVTLDELQGAWSTMTDSDGRMDFEYHFKEWHAHRDHEEL